LFLPFIDKDPRITSGETKIWRGDSMDCGRRIRGTRALAGREEVLEAFAELYASLVTNPYRNPFLPLRVKVLVLLKVP
jgi:hypothetical protein